MSHFMGVAITQCSHLLPCGHVSIEMPELPIFPKLEMKDFNVKFLKSQSLVHWLHVFLF